MNGRKRLEMVNQDIQDENVRSGSNVKPKTLLDVMDLVRFP